jgi:prepilin-type N-terminal cleavage/methylation domain-containing protein
MISPTGDHKALSTYRQSLITPLKHQTLDNKKRALAGFTFIEIMITLVILSTGITVIFRVFFYSLDQMQAMTHRLYANVLIENRLSEIERVLKVYNALPFDVNKKVDAQLGQDQVTAEERISFRAFDEFPDLFEVNISLNWKEGKRDMKLTKTAYLLGTVVQK